MKKFLSFMVSLLVTITAFAGTKSVAEDVTPKSIKIGTDSFVQVTTAPDDWSGEYIIVANVGGKDLIWNGYDAGQNGIEAADTVAVVTVAKGTSAYSIKVNNGKNAGKYVGINSYKNGLYFNATATELKFEFKSGAVEISNTFDDGSVYLLYNKISGASNERFRFYKGTNLSNDNYLTPVLYKKAATAPTTATITVDGADRVKISSEATRTSTVLAAGDNSVEPGQYYLLVADVTKYTIKEVKVGENTVTASFGNYMLDLAAGDKVTVTTEEKAVPKTATITVDAADRVKVTDEATRTSTTLTAGENTVNAGNYYLLVTDATKYAIKEVKIGDNAVKENFGSYLLELTGDEKVTVTTEEKAPATATITVDASDRVKATNEATRTETALVAGDNTVAAGSYIIVGSSSDYIIKEVKVGENVIDATYGYYSVTISANDTVIVKTAAKPVLAEGDYIIANVEGGYLGGSNDWGTHATNINKPQWFTVTLSDGKYLLDSHQSNGGDSHYLASGLYVDAAAEAWEINYSDSTKTSFTVKINDKYLSAKDGLNKALALVDEADATCNWQFITLTDIKTSMNDAAKMNPVDVTALIKDPELKRNGNTSGFWTITGFNGEGTPSNFAQGQGKNIASCGESYHSSNGFKAVQTITLPKPGIYALSAQGFYRNDGEDSLIPYIFAGENKSNLPEKTGTENNMVEAYASFLQNVYPVDSVLFEATDYDQKIEIGVAGESNSKWNIFGEFSLNFYGPAPVEFDVTPAEATVETISEIVLSSDTTIVVNNNAKVSLLTMQSTVEEFSAEALKAGLAEDAKSIKITLATAVTAAGKYILNIPAGAFTIGGKANSAQMIEWTIEEKAKPAVELTVNAVNPSASEVEITFSGFASPGEDYNAKVSIKNEANEEVATATGAYGNNFMDAYTVKLEFSAKLAPGKYTTEVPEGFFVNPDEEGLNAVNIAAFTLEFTVPTPEVAGRTLPVPTSSALNLEGADQYFYNVEYGGFFAGANDWGTRASVSREKAMLLPVTAAGDTYKISTVSPDGELGVWVDGSRDGNDKFGFVLLDDNKFMITCTKFTGKVLTWGGDEANTRLNFTAETTNGTWIAVSPTDYEAFKEELPKVTIYKKAQQLKDIIEKAKADNVDVTAEQAVYDNLDATAAELDAAVASVQEKMTPVVPVLASLKDYVDNATVLVLNKGEQYIYGPNDQNIAMGDFATAIAESNNVNGYILEYIEKGGIYMLRSVKNGENVNIFGKNPTYLNSQPAATGVTFNLGKDQDGKDGSSWYIKEVEGGYTIQNVANGAYLNGANLSTDPVVWGITSREAAIATGIESISATSAKSGKYMENGKIIIIKNGVKYNAIGQIVK